MLTIRYPSFVKAGVGVGVGINLAPFLNGIYTPFHKCPYWNEPRSVPFLILPSSPEALAWWIPSVKKRYTYFSTITLKSLLAAIDIPKAVLEGSIVMSNFHFISKTGIHQLGNCPKVKDTFHYKLKNQLKSVPCFCIPVWFTVVRIWDAFVPDLLYSHQERMGGCRCFWLPFSASGQVSHSSLRRGVH